MAQMAKQVHQMDNNGSILRKGRHRFCGEPASTTPISRRNQRLTIAIVSCLFQLINVPKWIFPKYEKKCIMMSRPSWCLGLTNVPLETLYQCKGGGVEQGKLPWEEFWSKFFLRFQVFPHHHRDLSRIFSNRCLKKSIASSSNAKNDVDFLFPN